MSWCTLLTAVKNYNKSIEKMQDFFFKTETKTKTSWSNTKTKTFIFVFEAPRDHDPGLEDYVTGKTNLSTLLQAVVNRDCWEKSQNHKEAGNPKRLWVSTGDCWSWPDWPWPHILRQMYATGVLGVRGLTIGLATLLEVQSKSFSSQRQRRKTHKTPWWCTASMYAEVMHCWEVLR